MQSTIFDYLGQPHEIDGFRDMYPTFFQLVYNLTGSNVTTEIEEPTSWDDVWMVISRNPQYHGFNYEALDSFSLASDCPAGKSIINAMYKKYGADALITLQIGAVIDEETKIIEHEGRLNLNTRSVKAGLLTCDVEANTLQTRIQAKADIKLGLFNLAALDDTEVTPATINSTILHSKAFREVYSCLVNDEQTTEGFVQKDSDIWILPDLSNPQKEDIKKIYDKRPLGISFIDPVENKNAFWKAFSDGKYTVSVTWDADITIGITPRSFFLFRELKFKNYTAQPYLVQERDGSVIKKVRLGEGSYNNPTLEGNQIRRFTVSVDAFTSTTLEVRQGDNIHLFIEVKYTYKGANELGTTKAKVISSNFNLQIDGVSRNVQSFGNGLLVYDAVQQAIRIITGRDDCFRSSFFGKASDLYAQDGDGANYLLTNGFLIRRFDRAIEQHYKTISREAFGKFGEGIKYSYKDLVEGLNAIFGIGYEYTVENSVPIIRMEKAEYFYKGGEILRINEVSKLGEDTAKELIFSTIQVGYSKYFDEGLNYLDEFNTYHEYSTPIRTENGRYQITSNLIASGYAIEATRREQFDDTPKDSTRYDDDLFIISINPSIPTYQGIATFSNNALLFANRPFLILPVKPGFCEIGTRLIISGTTHHNSVFKIMRIFDFGVQTLFVLDKLLPGEVVSNATIQPYEFAGYCERDENFSIVQNLLEPETSYNLRITPKRNLLNHAAWLNSGLAYKRGDEVYYNTFTKLNKELVTQKKNDDAFPACDPDHLLLSESGNLTIENANRGKRIFSPEWINFECRLTEAEFNTIRNALRGWNNDETDYGYLTITDLEGNDVSGYPFEIRRQKKTGKSIVKMLKRYVSADDEQSVDCTDYTGWIFEQFESNPVPASAEKCQMAVFG